MWLQGHWQNVQGFYMRVVPSKRNLRNTFGVEEAIAMSLRAATTFTIGFRAFYAFIPLVRALQHPSLCATFQHLRGNTLYPCHSADGALSVQLMWLFGPTALLCTTVMEVGFQSASTVAFHSASIVAILFFWLLPQTPGAAR
jgi:hypothetical protein